MALDYNPDREGHREKTWLVIKANTNPNFKGVKIGNKMLKFGKDNAFRVSDPVLADEIRKTVKRDATVTRLNADKPVSDRGHRYFFGQMPAMPWHKYDENGKRIV